MQRDLWSWHPVTESGSGSPPLAHGPEVRGPQPEEVVPGDQVPKGQEHLQETPQVQRT